MSFSAYHCFLQPKKNEHKMMMSFLACCRFLQPKKKSQNNNEIKGLLLFYII